MKILKRQILMTLTRQAASHEKSLILSGEILLVSGTGMMV